MTTRRPTIRRGPASQYAGAGEAIAEFSDGASGGLISVRRNGDGALLVDVYQTDADVIARGPAGQTRPVQRFIPYPTLGPVAVIDPRGKVSGVVTLTATGRSDETGRPRVFVRTDGAHINDHNPAVDFRGESWLVSLLLELDDSGQWQNVRRAGFDVTRRATWSDAPPSYAATIAAAMCATAAEHVTPELLRLGERADIAQDLHRVDEQRVRLEAELAEANRRATDLRVALSAVENDDDV